MEIKPGNNIGSYHIIDGVKVNIRYLGQQPTCGRCHLIASRCKGGGLAKNCEAKGGQKVDFYDYIKQLWRELDYYPEDADDSNYYEDVTQTDKFTPQKVNSFPVDQFNGVCIKQIPRDTDHGDILEFLCENGLPEDKREGVKINDNGTVLIHDLDSYIVEYLITTIHGKVHFGKKLYCNGVIPLTPNKSEVPHVNSNANKSSILAESTNLENKPKSPLQLQTETVHDNPSVTDYIPIDSSVAELDSVNQLVRRHSLSLKNRTPPPKSMAEELLNTPRIGLNKTANMIVELRNLTEHLSDFASCISSGDSDKDVDTDEFKSFVETKRQKRNKRKQRQSPTQDHFLKKPNLSQAH